VPELSAFELEVAIEKLKRHKSPSIDQIPAELIKAGSRTVHSEIHNLINSVFNKEELSEEWSQSFYIFMRTVIKQTVVIIEAYHFFQLHTKFYPNPAVKA
jgi:hypothetical protein